MASKGAMAGRQEEEERQVAAQTVTGHTKVCQTTPAAAVVHVTMSVLHSTQFNESFYHCCLPLQLLPKQCWRVSAVLMLPCCHSCVRSRQWYPAMSSTCEGD